MLIFFQNLGNSVVIVIVNTIFAQSLTTFMPRYAPSVSTEATLNAGSSASGVRNLAAGHEDELNGVLHAYSDSLRNIFYFLVGMSGLAVLASLGMGWKDIRNKKTGDENAAVAMKEEEV